MAPSFSIEDELRTALDRHLNGPNVAPRLAEAIRYSLLSPGKRIRPRLAIECGTLIGLPQAAALSCALSIEMLHCFTLIHDDLPCMDDDDFRRGLPANHKKFDEATALLAGDALMAIAFDVLLEAEPHVHASGLLAGIRRLASASGPRGVIGGQALEETLSSRSTLKDLQTVHAGKTGALFEAALLIPKDLSGLPDTDPRTVALEHFASALGLAFQVLDDLDDGLEEATSPANILYYVSGAEMQAYAIDPLEKASHGLSMNWGAEAAISLTRIASDIIQRIQNSTALT